MHPENLQLMSYFQISLLLYKLNGYFIIFVMNKKYFAYVTGDGDQGRACVYTKYAAAYFNF